MREGDDWDTGTVVFPEEEGKEEVDVGKREVVVTEQELEQRGVHDGVFEERGVTHAENGEDKRGDLERLLI